MQLLILVIGAYIAYSLVFSKSNLNKNNKSKSKNLDIEQGTIYPYISKGSLLTKAELNFYNVLKLVISNTDYYIAPMVRLADIIQVYKTENAFIYFNKIKAKHIDFLLVDKYTFKPMIAIELDDSSHDFDNRKLRDDFLKKALYAADLKLVRFKAYQAYKVSEIREKLEIKVPYD
ncbi:MAG: DUF2726 domain-containing protein [Tissierellaceae bacterium]|nr:DUF2726 domain-containing protein [Tissierellaceae bacterium]